MLFSLSATCLHPFFHTTSCFLFSSTLFFLLLSRFFYSLLSFFSSITYLFISHTPPFIFLFQLVFLICIFHIFFSFSHALSFFLLIHLSFVNCLLRYSSPTPSLVPFSHSLYSHASPSTIFILFRASFFPFSRFSLHLFCSISYLFLRALSLFSHTR